MKKLLIIIATLWSAIAVSQAQAIEQGDRILNVGVGLGSYARYTTIPPLQGSFDYAVKDNLFDDNSALSIGGLVGFFHTKSDLWEQAHNYGFSTFNLIMGARTAVHYHFVENLDTYAGIMLGYQMTISKYHGEKLEGFNPTPNEHNRYASGLYVGARYYITPKYGVFGELGYGISMLTIGASIKI